MSDEFENDNLNYDGQEEGQDYPYESDQGSYDDSQDYSDEPQQDYDDGQDYADDGQDYSDDGYDNSSNRGASREAAKMKKEWANSIVTNKRVKREEMRRKLKRAMLFMLVFALIVTSVVYIMLLFIQENNVRITASSQNGDSSISLSFDNNYWTPYLNAQGPTEIWNVSYSPVYKTERIDTVDEVYALLSADSVPVGTNNGENFIRFTFMLRNNGRSDVHIDYKMNLEYGEDGGLQDAVRVMWGESIKNYSTTGDDPDASVGQTRTTVTVYASRSTNQRLANTAINSGSDGANGYTEYIAYPSGSDQPDYDWKEDFYDKLNTSDGISRNDAEAYGYLKATTPFADKNAVFENTTDLAQGDIMYCYVCIWLEGSDYDCVDRVIGDFVTLGIDFVAYS